MCRGEESCDLQGLLAPACAFGPPHWSSELVGGRDKQGIRRGVSCWRPCLRRPHDLGSESKGQAGEEHAKENTL